MIPYNFILNYIFPQEVVTKKKFGIHAIYLGNKIFLAKRK